MVKSMEQEELTAIKSVNLSMVKSELEELSTVKSVNLTMVKISSPEEEV